MGNPITNHLPLDIDDFLHDIAQIYGGLSYFDIINFRPTKIQVKKLRNLISKFYDKKIVIDDIARVVKGFKKL